MDIKKVYLIETSKNLYEEIKMFEKDRIQNDLTNKNKLIYLYELYYSTIDELNTL